MELRQPGTARLTARRLPGRRRRAGDVPLLSVLVLAAAALLGAPATAAAEDPELETPPSQTRAPAGYSLTANGVTGIARRTDSV